MRPKLPLDRIEVFGADLDHPEGLAFDEDGTLWAGGEQGQIYKIDASGSVTQVASLSGFNLGLTFSSTQDLFVCNLKLSALIQLDRGGKVIRSWTQAGGYRLRTPNFSVFDRAGNLYFTDSGEWQKNDGFLFVLRSNGSIETLLRDLPFPNGLALSADERTLYVVQSTTNDVLAVPVAEGQVKEAPHVFARGLLHVPDGAALDSKGNLYVTCYASHRIYRVSPRGVVSLFAEDPQGTLIASPTNIAFGGDGLTDMYIANLSRWHICRIRGAGEGQPLAAQQSQSVAREGQ